MSALLVLFLGVLLVPLFVASWRISLIGLSLQGVLLGVLTYKLHSPNGVTAWLSVVEFALVRGALAPILLYSVERRRTNARHDVIPPNLLSWTAIVALVVLAFNFAPALVPHHGFARSLAATAASSVALGLFVLATQTRRFSQVMGALRIENAVALLEVGSSSHRPPVLHLALVLVYALTVLAFRWFLTDDEDRADGAESEDDNATSSSSPGQGART